MSGYYCSSPPADHLPDDFIPPPPHALTAAGDLNARLWRSGWHPFCLSIGAFPCPCVCWLACVFPLVLFPAPVLFNTIYLYQYYISTQHYESTVAVGISDE